MKVPTISIMYSAWIRALHPVHIDSHGHAQHRLPSFIRELRILKSPDPLIHVSVRKGQSMTWALNSFETTIACVSLVVLVDALTIKTSMASTVASASIRDNDDVESGSNDDNRTREIKKKTVHRSCDQCRRKKGSEFFLKIYYLITDHFGFTPQFDVGTF